MRIAVLHLRDERPHAPTYQALLDQLTGATVEAITALDWEPVPVACAQVAVGDSLAAAAAADGIVIVGGEDVNPALYGGQHDYPEAGAFEPYADAAHIAVVRAAVASRTPLLGICRGHQIVNVALGGTLVQHLPTTQHHRGTGHGRDAFVAHNVHLTPEGGLYGDVDPSEPVLCTHHQAIGRLAGGLRVAARAHDKVIEAVVHETAPITGVQWHPEHPDVAARQLTALLRRLERQALG